MKYRLHKVTKAKIRKKELWRQFCRIFFIQAALFLLTALFALVASLRVQQSALLQQAYFPEVSLLSLFFSFLIATALLLILIFFKKKIVKLWQEKIYKGIFVIACFSSGIFLFSLFLPTFLGVVLLGILLFFWLKAPKLAIHNGLLTIAFAGVAVYFGLRLGSSWALLLLLIFSVYDFIAVYRTKHMVAIAKAMIENKAILGFVIPNQWQDFNSSLKQKNIEKQTLIIGGGDIVFPLVVAVSLVPLSMAKALVVILFSLFGLLASYYIFSRQKEKHPIPALPPIALFVFIGYCVTLFF